MPESGRRSSQLAVNVDTSPTTDTQSELAAPTTPGDVAPAVSQTAQAQPTEVADEAIVAAERIGFLALASELARERSVLVVDDGASALSGVATRLDSVRLEDIATVESGCCEVVVLDIDSADQATAERIAELSRVVVADEGVALVRMPNRPEFEPLLATLQGGFSRSLPLRQHNWVSSAIFDDKMFANDDPARAVAATVRKLAPAAPENALYNVVVATHGAFPTFRSQLALTRSPQLTATLAELERTRRQIREERDEAAARISEQDARIRELEDEFAWYDEHHLMLRKRVEDGGLVSLLLAIWVFVASNLHRVRRALRG